jgi:predicted lactoylglutathione lyase
MVDLFRRTPAPTETIQLRDAMVVVIVKSFGTWWLCRAKFSGVSFQRQATHGVAEAVMTTLTMGSRATAETQNRDASSPRSIR